MALTSICLLRLSAVILGVAMNSDALEFDMFVVTDTSSLWLEICLAMGKLRWQRLFTCRAR